MNFAYPRIPVFSRKKRIDDAAMGWGTRPIAAQHILPSCRLPFHLNPKEFQAIAQYYQLSHVVITS
ncbi:hypothetical protein REMIM1_CH01942 [Rhizobium etli bv. mimosae str. Mim1]|nr:hypothetical protein REMIM1_CH01942 [Rhizobium etli bv. mimosae str. Mim1]